jgi:hypothetical protein
MQVCRTAVAATPTKWTNTRWTACYLLSAVRSTSHVYAYCCVAATAAAICAAAVAGTATKSQVNRMMPAVCC